MAAKPAIGSGWIAASVPPATTTSARPDADHVRGVGDGLGAGRAGADRRVDAGAGPELDADRGGRAVGHQHRHGQREDPARALLLQRVVGRQQRPDAADPGRDDHSQALGVELGPAGVGPGLPRGGERVLPGRVQPPGLHPAQLLDRVDGDRRREGDRQVHLGDPVLGQGAGAGAAGEGGVPGRGHVTAEGRGGTEAGDHDARAGRCHGEVRSLGGLVRAGWSGCGWSGWGAGRTVGWERPGGRGRPGWAEPARPAVRLGQPCACWM